MASQSVGSDPVTSNPAHAVAPVVGFAAVVDGTAEGLPDVPYRLIQAGKINRSPTGDPISVILGTNRDEMALFLVALPFVIPGVKLPFQDDGMQAQRALDSNTLLSQPPHRTPLLPRMPSRRGVANPVWQMVADHLAQYHSNWGAAEAAQIVAAYPRSDYETGNSQIVRAGTDFCFACGTRSAARALATAGINTFLYSFEYEFKHYRKLSSPLCSLTAELGCGVYHSAELSFVFQKASGRDATMATAMGGYWSNFAKTGNPNGAGLVEWPRYSTAADRHLRFAATISAAAGLRNTTCDFWDTMPKESPYNP